VTGGGSGASGGPTLPELFGDEVPGRLEALADAALERNARDGLVLDLRGISDATDFFVILTGESDVHSRAIAENLVERLEEHDERPVGVEGKESGRWILLDYVDIVVHIFLPQVREFYQLERLWGDAPRAAVAEASASA